MLLSTGCRYSFPWTNDHLPPRKAEVKNAWLALTLGTRLILHFVSHRGAPSGVWHCEGFQVQAGVSENSVAAIFRLEIIVSWFPHFHFRCFCLQKQNVFYLPLSGRCYYRPHFHAIIKYNPHALFPKSFRLLLGLSHFSPTYGGNRVLQNLGFEPQKDTSWCSVKLGKQQNTLLMGYLHFARTWLKLANL